MKIGVVGRHPSLEHGFNGVMSLLWAKGLSRNGCKVVLLLPETEVHDPKWLLKKAGFCSWDKLDHFGVDVEIRPFKYAHEIDSDIDAIIWQSYRPQEESLRVSVKKRGFFLAKNPPRLFSGNKERDYVKAKGLSEQYDFIAASLISDMNESFDLSPLEGRIEYVPRGFDVESLSPNQTSVVTVGFDKAVKAQDLGSLPIDHIISSGVSLKEKIPDMEFLSLRDSVKVLGSKRVPLLGYPDFYDEFIRKLWVYMPINFDHSVHVTGKVEDKDYGHRYVGLYENQVIEAQLAGAMVICRRGDIPNELLMVPEYSNVSTYQDSNQLFSLLLDNVQNFESRSKVVREKAIERHDFLNTTRVMKDEISKRL